MQEPRRPAMANLQFVSKRMVVLPEYRGQGIGYRLKLAQRELAIAEGVRLVVWTFDPLLSLNAHLNIRKLGALCSAYSENYYGTSEEGGLTTFGMSDRLMVEWWVTNRRVEERIFGSRSDLTLSHYLEAETAISESFDGFGGWVAAARRSNDHARRIAGAARNPDALHGDRGEQRAIGGHVAAARS